MEPQTHAPEIKIPGGRPIRVVFEIKSRLRDDLFSVLLVSSEALMQCNSEHTKCGSNLHFITL